MQRVLGSKQRPAGRIDLDQTDVLERWVHLVATPALARVGDHDSIRRRVDAWIDVTVLRELRVERPSNRVPQYHSRLFGLLSRQRLHGGARANLSTQLES
jgi:hypothetical protein